MEDITILKVTLKMAVDHSGRVWVVSGQGVQFSDCIIDI